MGIGSFAYMKNGISIQDRIDIEDDFLLDEDDEFEIEPYE